MNGIGGRLRSHFESYEDCHRTEGNRITHEVGIPLILISTLGLLARLRVPGVPLTVGMIVWFWAMLWACGFCFEHGRFSWSHFALIAPYGLVTLGAYFGGAALPVSALWLLLAIGWALQLLGHAVFEKRSPAFFMHLKQLFVGPLWIFARIFRS